MGRMRRMGAAAIAVVSVLAGVAWAQEKTLAFATIDEGRKILTARDEFVQVLSPFDRGAALKTDRDVAEKDYLAFVGRSVLDWTEADKEALAPTLNAVKAGLGRYPLPFPKTVYLIKTTGEEEGDAPYTRSDAIILPKSHLTRAQKADAELIYHELFHVLSRTNPDLKEKLYAAIGFRKCDEVNLPGDLKSRRITNPDGPRNDHCIAVEVAGRPVWAVPILFSDAERYDPNRGGSFFDYMQFRFLVVPRDGNSPPARMPPAGQEAKLVEQKELTGFFEQIGRNTEYTIHPDEILADNFASLMMQDRDVRSPEILKKIEAILSARD
jgi:hypothetical protein